MTHPSNTVSVIGADGMLGRAVVRALEESEGVQTVRVELKSGRVVLTGNRLEPARLIEKIEALGYQVVTGK